MVTAVSGFIEQVNGMIKGIQKQILINQPYHISIKLQRAGRDTCLLAITW